MGGEFPLHVATLVGQASLVPRPTYERGSGDIRLIPGASLISGEKFLSANHIAEKTISSTALEIHGYFSTMTQFFST